VYATIRADGETALVEGVAAVEEHRVGYVGDEVQVVD
jgi:hypothetical protein